MKNPVVDIVLSMLGSVVFLAIAVVAWLRGRQKNVQPVAWPFALLCVDLFAYNLLQAIADLTDQQFWGWMNAAAAAAASPFFYHLVIAFVGRRRQFARPLIAVYAYFTALALACFAPLFIPGNTFPGSSTWALIVLLGEIPVLAQCSWLLIRNLSGTSRAERSRTRLVLASALIGGLSTIADLVSFAGASWSPHIAVWGLLLAALILGAAALQLIEGITLLTWASAAAVAFTVVLAELAVFRGFGDQTALIVVATVIVALLAAAALRFIVTDYAAWRERTMAHASLGRMAAQMAHDIKNPLASLRGTAQFLMGEREAGRSIDQQGEFLSLLVEQCDRLARIVDQYHRIGRAEPMFAKASLNDAVKESMKFLGSAAPLDLKLAETVPACAMDRDLIVIALENVLRNAHEAAVGKPVHVETGTLGEGDDTGWVYVAVRDEGPGMSPRTRERALEGFFTTKTQGSGLGLAFVRRVVESHRGRLKISAGEGHGTTVRIELRTSV